MQEVLTDVKPKKSDKEDMRANKVAEGKGKGKEENHTTSTLTVGKKQCLTVCLNIFEGGRRHEAAGL